MFNEWTLAGAAVVVTIITLGGGGFLMRTLFRKKSNKPADKT